MNNFVITSSFLTLIIFLVCVFVFSLQRVTILSLLLRFLGLKITNFS